MRRPILILTSIALCATAVWALWPEAAPELSVKNAQAFPLKGAPRAAMVTLTVSNAGGADRLMDVASNVAKLAILKSLDTTGLPIPASASGSLTMGAGHIMLTGLQAEPIQGDLLPITLQFERAGAITVNARVSNAPGVEAPTLNVPPDQAPALTLTTERAGDGWALRMTAQNFTFAQDAAPKPHKLGTGHARLFVHGMELGRYTTPTIEIPALPPGEHKVRVTLHANDGRPYSIDGRAISAQTTILEQ
ncbi:MAG: copper chaperone PCu(A)C [Pseudomonadota bacterium]